VSRVSNISPRVPVVQAIKLGWRSLFEYTEARATFIVPVQRRNELPAFLSINPLKDLAVNRGSRSWCIPVPGDEPQVLYVCRVERLAATT
jgi:methionyl-tRNA synthetase